MIQYSNKKPGVTTCIVIPTDQDYEVLPCWLSSSSSQKKQLISKSSL